MKKSADYKQILNDCDCEEDENPKGFDWRKAEDDFVRVTVDLKTILFVRRIDSQGQIQDASFHGDIICSEGSPEYWQSIRFSNFGRLVTIRNVDQIPFVKLEKILEIFKLHQYQYIPIEVLDQSYDGRFGPLYRNTNKQDTWFDRYFSHI